MISKEMIEDAANKYLQTELELERVLGLEYIESDVVKENILTDFEAGANWAIEQMSNDANDAVEFIKWTQDNHRVHISNNVWASLNNETNKTYSTQELYQLYLNSKTK